LNVGWCNGAVVWRYRRRGKEKEARKEEGGGRRRKGTEQEKGLFNHWCKRARGLVL
jgi:hypothetical protein